MTGFKRELNKRRNKEIPMVVYVIDLLNARWEGNEKEVFDCLIV
jgi:hypothetical protein